MQSTPSGLNSSAAIPSITRRGLLQIGSLAAGSATGLSLAAGPGADAAPATGGGGPSDLREHLLRCLGGGWPDPCDLKPEVRSTVQKDGYRLESVSYEAEPGERVPAYLLVPDGVSASSPAPGVAVWHPHGGQWKLGKDWPAGFGPAGLEHRTGVDLAHEGYVVLCPDALCFGERRRTPSDGVDYERFEFCRYVVMGKSMAWKNILDMRRAIDYLVSRPEVQPDRIGCYGHSMGSTFTWLIGPWEPRLKALVGNCCLPTYAAIHRTGIIHCFPNYIPGFFQYGDTPDIAGLTAPRPLHLNLGEEDEGSPIEEARAGLETIAAAYARAGAADRFTSFVEPGAGHVLSEQMWAHVKRTLGQYLRS